MGRGPIHERPVNIIFQIHKWTKYCGRFTDIVALKTNDSYRYFLSRQEKKGGPRAKLPENFRIYAYSILGKRPVLI